MSCSSSTNAEARAHTSVECTIIDPRFLAADFSRQGEEASNTALSFNLMDDINLELLKLGSGLGTELEQPPVSASANLFHAFNAQGRQDNLMGGMAFPAMLSPVPEHEMTFPDMLSSFVENEVPFPDMHFPLLGDETYQFDMWDVEPQFNFQGPDATGTINGEPASLQDNIPLPAVPQSSGEAPVEAYEENPASLVGRVNKFDAFIESIQNGEFDLESRGPLILLDWPIAKDEVSACPSEQPVATRDFLQGGDAELAASLLAAINAPEVAFSSSSVPAMASSSSMPFNLEDTNITSTLRGGVNNKNGDSIRSIYPPLDENDEMMGSWRNDAAIGAAIERSEGSMPSAHAPSAEPGRASSSSASQHPSRSGTARGGDRQLPTCTRTMIDGPIAARQLVVHCNDPTQGKHLFAGRQKPCNIKSGDVYVFLVPTKEEREAGKVLPRSQQPVSRWTDNIAWTPERQHLGGSIYREKAAPPAPGESKKVIPKGDRQAGEESVDRLLLGPQIANHKFRPNGLIKMKWPIMWMEREYGVVSYYREADARQLPTYSGVPLPAIGENFDYVGDYTRPKPGAQANGTRGRKRAHGEAEEKGEKAPNPKRRGIRKGLKHEIYRQMCTNDCGTELDQESQCPNGCAQ